MKEKRIGKIDFLRFYVSITIIIGHLFNNLSLDDYKFAFFTLNNKFSLGVEFFWLVSGFFVATSAYEYKGNNFSRQTIIYTIKRIRSFLMEHLFSCLLTLLVFIVYSKQFSLPLFIKTIIRFIPSLLLLSRWGFNENIMGHEWYLSCLIICGAIIYFLVLKFKHNFSRILSPFLSLIMMSAYFNIENSYHSATMFVFNGIIHGNVIRSFSGMMIGVFIYEIVDYLNKNYINRKYDTFFTLIEIICLTICFYIKNQTSKKYELLYILLLGIALIIILSKLSLTNKFFNNKLIFHLGKLSLPMYLCQYASIYITNMLFCFINNGILAAIICTVLCMLFGEIILALSTRMRIYFDLILKDFLNTDDFNDIYK